ncbi:unnamed protein product [Mytilus edulis]|uniref:Uncharacterized protein n=1 Tax=Mytilus edulis TaxID=6550 RepID=A0A8S3S4X2_MYTED|nr:unnamed protein product [Mytilus edulis]
MLLLLHHSHPCSLGWDPRFVWVQPPRRLATPVSAAVPSSFVDVPAATVGLAANQDEDAEYILPQIFGSEVPVTSTQKPQPVQTPPPSLAQPPTHNLNQQILTALSTFTTIQELLLKEITHNTKAIQTLSTNIAYLRGQFRQFERVQGRHQTIQDSLSNQSNRPFKQIRRKPYLNRPKLQQRQPKVKSVVEKKDLENKEN